jgi:AraC-like DNA-binding protein
MINVAILRFSAPPLPHYIVSGFAKSPAGYQHPNRKDIGVFDLLVVREGELWIGEDEEKWRVGAGGALILRPDRHHYPTAGCLEETHAFWLHFQTTGDWCEAESDSWLAERDKDDQRDSADDVLDHQEKSMFSLETFPIQISQFCQLPHPTQVYEKLEKLVYLEAQMLSRNKWQHQLIFQEILQDLASAQQVNSNNASLQVAEKAATYLRIHYKEEISYPQLGKVLNFHPAYITRCMNKIFGCTPLEYLIRYRLEQAKLLLLNTDLPVGRVGEEVGFNHSSYFSNCFARCEGVTPSVYRRKYMKQGEL